MTQLERIKQQILQLTPQELARLRLWFVKLKMESLKTTNRQKPPYHNLDHLAGTWSSEDAKEFEQALTDFE